MTTTEPVEIHVLGTIHGVFFSAYLPVSCICLNAGLN